MQIPNSTGRELLLRAMRGETTPRPPWVPYVGVHGGQLIGVPAGDYLRSSEHIVAGLKRAHERYRPDGLPVTFDVQLEAEVLGCRLRWSDDTPPSVASHPLADAELESLPRFSATGGRFPIVFEALRRVKRDLGDRVALYGLITGPFTLTMHLLGNDLFLEMFDRPERVEQIAAFCAEVGKQTAAAYLAEGADVIAVVDPMTSQISPAHFEQFVAPYANAIFDHVRARGGLSSLFVCGDATRNLEAMCRTRCDNLSVDENVSLDELRRIAQACGKSFGGNLRLTAALLLGDEDDARRDALRCLDAGGTTGFILAPGCDLPYDVPARNLEVVAELAHDEYQREVARTTLGAAAERTESVTLPDYRQEPQVIVDVVTLDSASCAPCQYMMVAVHGAASRLASPIVIREHKIKTHEGISVMRQLGVTNLPTICIDGQPSFVSLIPDQQTLVRSLEAAAAAKPARQAVLRT